MIKKCALIAGGMATRLYPVTKTIPKSLININGKPFISHQLNLLKNNGITEVVICSGYLGDQIKDVIKEGKDFKINVKYSFDGDKLLGTGGTIKKALHMLGDVFFVMYGDSYLPINFKEVSDFYDKTNKKALMVIIKNDNIWDKSNLIYKNNKIIKYDKKDISSDMKYIDYGLGILTKGCFLNIKENDVIDLADIYKDLVNQEQLAGFEVNKRFYEIGSFQGIQETEEYFISLNRQ